MLFNARSYYSLRYGVLSPERLVAACAALGYDTVGLTDINTTAGIYEFIKESRKAGIRPLVGIEFRNDNRLKYIGIARNALGIQELNEFLSRHLLGQSEFPDEAGHFVHANIIYPFGDYLFEQRGLEGFGAHEFIGVPSYSISQYRRLAHRRSDRFLLWQPVLTPLVEDFSLHRQLRAIDRNVLLSQLPASDVATNGELLASRRVVCERFSLAPELEVNTRRVLEGCEVDFSFEAVKNKKTFSATAADDRALLGKLAYEGLQVRYGNDRAAAERVRHELEIIDKLGFATYFLITWDMIRYSMLRGFYHVGRGSGANSVVAYCLRITDVCPIELDLYFERFLNPKRTSPPDFDIDYSWKNRDEVIDYLFKRYGAGHTALLGAMSTFRDRAIIRELGKVHGLPKAEIDAMIDAPASPTNRHAIAQKILADYDRLADFPNQRTIHAGGVMISELPITAYSALDLPPKGFPTTHIDMYAAEDISFHKLDVLSQRGIGHIKDAVVIIQENRGEAIDIHAVKAFKTNARVQGQLRSGDTIGCFYIESPAMRQLLKKLRCSDYLTLVAASSIIRPGVARSGMMREYIKRFHNPNGFTYLHPVMAETLRETYGVMVYQEDVLKVCHRFAKLDLADGDVLRRMMSGKHRNKKHLEAIVEKFFDNCRAEGYPEGVAEEVWRQIESFAGYSFSKAHSASFAVESLQSLYLKAHYPIEFMTAVINNFGGFYRTWVYVNEARLAGAAIELPCVNRSAYLTAVDGKTITLGLIHIQHLDRAVADRLLATRQREGVFRSLHDLARRADVPTDQLTVLIRAGALRFTGVSKKSLLWEAHSLKPDAGVPSGAADMFPDVMTRFHLPPLEGSTLEDAYDELELFGFPVSLSWVEMLQTGFRGECLARDLPKRLHQTVKMVGTFVTYKPVRTVKGKMMAFGTFLDVEGAFFDTVHFPSEISAYPFTGAGAYLILGKVVEEFGFHSLQVEKMAKLPLKPDPRSA